VLRFSKEDVKFPSISRSRVREWLLCLIKLQEKKSGDILIVFCSDCFLTEFNQKYLNHNTLTDIITFDYSENGLINGELYISTERVYDNAKIHKTTDTEELLRVMAHGVLHLLGYKDKKAEDKSKMRKMEEYALDLWNKMDV
jgi:probable rRNA maturation factor